MENLMNIPEDSVPCRARAKRGFATHPRSIAERVSLFYYYGDYYCISLDTNLKGEFIWNQRKQE